MIRNISVTKQMKNFYDSLKIEFIFLEGVFSEAARNLGIHANLLGRWKREQEDSGKCGSGTGNAIAMKAELNRLHKENKQTPYNGTRNSKKRRPPSSRKNRAEVSFYRYPEEYLQGIPIAKGTTSLQDFIWLFELKNEPRANKY